MSAIVCGKRSNIFEDLPASTPPASKRIRCSSSSPVRFSPPRTSSNLPSAQSLLIDHLITLFPDMDKQLLEKALEECGNDLDSAIRSLNELRLGSVDKSVDSTGSISEEAVDPNSQLQSEDIAAPEDTVAKQTYPADGAEWVELFVKEMMSASNIDDAKARASRVLEALEKSISARVSAETAQSFHQENVMLKEQMEALIPRKYNSEASGVDTARKAERV
ncbi:Ubiquitin system component Cue [Senna tora]|uniref:Ubiquitin system component Cue n=1 Tax=Senna tora TaxID=362788 RepID=A0A834W227_9FABA|nr:Ubiquitin system component Cue [Senna tora]